MQHEVHRATVACLLVGFAVPTRPAQAQVPLPAVRVDLLLLDIPYNTGFGGRAPSMQQSLGVTAGVYDVGHLLIERAWKTHTRLAKTTIAVVDFAAEVLPFGESWLHEEWHRAVLGRRGVNSQNDIYRLGLSAPSVSVSHVSDEDLSAMKREHPTDFVRLKAAGIEGEYSLVTRLEQEQFYSGSRAWHTALYWISTVHSVASLADTAGIDAMTDKANAREGTVAARDISGHDFTAWVRDLFRPSEAWEARGVHPSGVGVNRYTKTTDLTADERAYLHGEGRLAFLNFADPNLFGVQGFTVWAPDGGEPLRLNVTMRHLLTSFGHTVDANIFLKRGAAKLFVVLHAYDNDERILPGLDAEFIDQPRTIGGRSVEFSPRLALWIQPAAQAFRTRDTQFGGLAGLRARIAVTPRLGAFVEADGKTAGWVAGIVQLDRAVNVRIGLSTTVQ